MTALRAQKRAFPGMGFCLMCLIFLALPAFTAEVQEGYVAIEESDDGSIIDLYLPSVEERRHHSGSYVVGWVRVSFSDEFLEQGPMAYIVPLISLLNYGKVDHAMYFYAANKSFKQLQQLSFAIYDEDGRQIYSETNPFDGDSWEECVPNSAGETLWHALMEAAGE